MISNLTKKINLEYLQILLMLKMINLHLQKVILLCVIIEKMINVRHGN